MKGFEIYIEMELEHRLLFQSNLATLNHIDIKDYLETEWESIFQFLGYAFDWKRTREGEQYWKDVLFKLEDYLVL